MLVILVYCAVQNKLSVFNLGFRRPNMDMHKTRSTFMTVNEVAELLSIGRTSLYKLLKTGRLKSVLIGSSRRIPVSAYEEYVSNLDFEQSI